ncbi:MAG: UDP-galactopyranose mutase [Candidatus Pacebacteria bacterium]|nr:UDP-galactopyranose mutase [Candidatus Paceibacterota bacterium]
MADRVLIVGAGLTGATLARQLADRGMEILLIDKRAHLAGNCFDQDLEDILVSRYGAHLFHTNSKAVWQFLQKFADWRAYEHQVLTKVNDQSVVLPVNINTINQLFGLKLKTGAEMRHFLTTQALKIKEINSLADYLLSKVGEVIYQKIFYGYSFKQWGLDPALLDTSISNRLPIRYNFDNRYFTDKYQALPTAGYTALVKKMLDHPQIKVQLKQNFFKLSKNYLQKFNKIIYTGPIDQYFNYKYGRLEYRSLKFEFCKVNAEFYQNNSVINYPDLTVPYTRIIEFKYFAPTKVTKHTIIAREYPKSKGEPYYPVPRTRNHQVVKKYLAKVSELEQKGVYFAGRLGTYRYLNMDEAVAEAMKLAERID